MEGSQFKGLGISYKNTPLAVRELLTFTEEEAKNLMLKIKDCFDISELLVVSTCNRTEVYYVASQNHNQNIAKLLLTEKGQIDSDDFLHYFASYDSQEETSRHLFEVATGLHSQVVGDMQIPNQVKSAYQWSADLNMAGPYLHRLLHTIFFANKRVTQETAFRDGAASTSYIAVDLIEQATTLKQNPTILVLGIGEIGRDVCLNLKERGYVNVVLCNRTYDKALKLAQETGFSAVNFEKVNDCIYDADVIISSIVRDKPYLTKSLLRPADNHSYKYIIDLSVPRSVAAEVEELASIIVYNIDSLQERANEVLSNRLSAVPKVKEIISQSLAEFLDWSKEMAVSPTIQKLKNALEQIRQEEMGRYLKNLSEEESARIDKITAGMMQKIIKLPVLQLKAACKRGEAETLIDVLNDLFNLEAQAETQHS